MSNILKSITPNTKSYHTELCEWDILFPPSKMLKKHWNSLYLHAKL